MITARDWGVDCIISLDADLQDDIAAIPEMVASYTQGNDIVYGVRNDRTTDTAFKRRTAHMFYGFMRWLKVPLIPDHADYRLVARPVLEALDEVHEHSLFLRGLFPALGFKSAQVYYMRQSRMAGESKYPFWKMVSFAWKGITACSAAPLRFAGLMSMLCMLSAMAFIGGILLIAAGLRRTPVGPVRPAVSWWARLRRRRGDAGMLAAVGLVLGLVVFAVSGWFVAVLVGPLAAVGVTMPPWPGEDEAIDVGGPWAPQLTTL